MSTVEIEQVEPHIRMIRLARPERLNAMSFPLVADLHDALDEVGGDPACKVIVLTGAGRAFCAGLDLRDYGTPPAPGTHRHVHAGIDGQAFLANLTIHMRETPQPIVAAVNGPAFGGGLSLACAADVRIAGASARFCSAFIRTGLSGTDAGISYLLPRLIGNARAFDLILSGRDIDAETAERYGLVSRVVPDEDLLEATLAYARILAGHTRTGLLLTKEVLWHNADATSMAACVAMENRNQTIASRTPEVQEFMASYARRTTGRS